MNPEPARITTWQQVAESVDESTWVRIIDDLAPKSRAEALACRPIQAPRQSELRLTPLPNEGDP